jgi:cyanophycinase
MTSVLAALAFLATSFVAPESAGPAKGYLVIVGGGATGREITSKFLELAGGDNANIVTVPTANSEDQINIDAIRKRGYPGAKSFDVIHTRDRKVADSKEFVKPLLTATGVWLDGGRQWRLADAYLGTRTQREIKAVLDRGGVVGGSSAGATIQGSFLIRGAAGANGSDGDNRIMISPDHLVGFGLLSNSAIDQHILTRHRENDLEPVIKAHPELLGIGIDESTAIVVHGHEFEVIGKSKVAVWDGKDHDGKKYQFLIAGQKYDMAKREIER